MLVPVQRRNMVTKEPCSGNCMPSRRKAIPGRILHEKVTAFDQGEIFKGLGLKNHKSVQVECSNATIIQVYSRSLMQWIEQEFHSLLWAELYPFSKIKSEHWGTDAFKLWSWRRLLSPLDCKESKTVSPKGNHPWIIIGRTDAEAEALILWLPDAKSWLIGKNPDAGKDWGQEENGTTEDEMVGWHHRLNGHEFGCTLGVGDGQVMGLPESDTTERLTSNKPGRQHLK